MGGPYSPLMPEPQLAVLHLRLSVLHVATTAAASRKMNRSDRTRREGKDDPRAEQIFGRLWETEGDPTDCRNAVLRPKHSQTFRSRGSPCKLIGAPDLPKATSKLHSPDFQSSSVDAKDNPELSALLN